MAVKVTEILLMRRMQILLTLWRVTLKQNSKMVLMFLFLMEQMIIAENSLLEFPKLYTKLWLLRQRERVFRLINMHYTN